MINKVGMSLQTVEHHFVFMNQTKLSNVMWPWTFVGVVFQVGGVSSVSPCRVALKGSTASGAV